MTVNKVTVRSATPSEYANIGQLMVDVYSHLEGFPTPAEQPAYYALLATVGDLTRKPGVELLAALGDTGSILGAVVFFSDMQYYGSGGSATQEKNAAGFRLLAVSRDVRGLGIGKILTQACIDRARAQGLGQVIIHTTRAMQTAWQMYERLGFKRSPDLDFLQQELPVFGFRLYLNHAN